MMSTQEPANRELGVTATRLALAFLLLAALLGDAPVGANCDGEPSNLLAKRSCGFARDVEGWEGVETTVAHEAGEGNPEPGALSAAAEDGFALVLSPCVKTRGRSGYRVEAAVRVASGEVYSCAVAARQYTDGDCSEDREVLETTARVQPTAEWQSMEGTATPDRDADSAQLHLECNGEGAFRVLFDDVVLARQ